MEIKGGDFDNRESGQLVRKSSGCFLNIDKNECSYFVGLFRMICGRMGIYNEVGKKCR